MTINGTSAAIDRPAPAAGHRVDWVDYAKGICIVMVVMMHSTLGVEHWDDALPLRLPTMRRGMRTSWTSARRSP